MNMPTKIILAAKIFALLVTASYSCISPVYAGLPVFDGSNLSQNTVSALENVVQTMKQVEQYQTQLQQYENQLQNTAQPATNIWNQAQDTMSKLQSATNTLSYYKNQLGSIDGYLSQSQDTATYRNSACFSFNGCTPAQWAAMKNSQGIVSDSQKRANDALFRGLDQQQDSLESDAQKLEQLQNAAQGATGQVQAIGFANQLAAHQSNQLLEIRGLLMAQQNVIATRNQALADKEAKESAAGEVLRRGKFRASPAKAW